jgi:branched-chain amino acid transport system permease protein
LIPEIIIMGAVQGAVFALLAIGFSLVYGVGGILNLAHGAFYLIASYALFWFYPIVGVYGGIVVALTLTTLTGAAAYLLLVKPLQRTQIGVVIVTFGLAFFMEQLVRVIDLASSGSVQTHSVIGLVSGGIDVLGVRFDAELFVAFFGSLLIVSVVAIFIRRSKIGKSIRAVSQDRESAMLMGIDADKILMLTFTLSALLAGLAAILYIPASALVSDVGWTVLLNAFAIVVLGGMGSIEGSILGAFIISYASNIVQYSGYATLVAFVPLVVILVVLVLRPRGLLGKKEVS